MSSMNGQMTLIPATSSRLFSILAHVTGQPLLASFLAMLTGFLILDCMNSIGFLLYLTLKSSFSTSNFVFTSLMAHEYIIMISSKFCISCMKGFSSGRRRELMYLLFRAFVCIDSITPPKCKKLEWCVLLHNYVYYTTFHLCLKIKFYKIPVNDQ